MSNQLVSARALLKIAGGDEEGDAGDAAKAVSPSVGRMRQRSMAEAQKREELEETLHTGQY